MSFFDASSAGNATINAYGGTSGGAGGTVYFVSNTTANSTGGTSHISVFGNGALDISGHYSPGVTIGSLAGDGLVFLGANRLTIGSGGTSGATGDEKTTSSAPRDTVFSGLIQDGGSTAGTGGSVEKIGTGMLSLTNANTYTGGTVITAGTLVAGHDGALGSGNVNVATSQSRLTLQGGATNQYFGSMANLSLVTGSMVNLNFTGNLAPFGTLIVNGVVQPPGVYGAPGGGAPHQLPQFTGSGTVRATLPVAFSRKTHGGAVNFDIFLPLMGTAGIECRSGGANGDYRIVVTFLDTVTFNSASVTSGTASVATASASGTDITIDITGVANAQTITVTLVGINDGTNTGDLAVRMAVLLGDTNGNGTVNASDIGQTKSFSGQNANATNFRTDVNISGSISASDIGLVKSRAGTALPP